MRFSIMAALIVINTAWIWNHSYGKKPDWVRERPLSGTQYIGIGSAAKTDTGDYAGLAKSRALLDLASEISVSIYGKEVSETFAGAGISNEMYHSYIRSITRAELEGHRLVDTWEDKHTYTAYYRLSKPVFQAQRAEKIGKAVSLGRDFFLKARNEQTHGGIASAILFFMKALRSIQDYFNETLETECNGKKILLGNEIISSLQAVFSNIRLEPLTPLIDAKRGKPIQKDLMLHASCSMRDDSLVPISNLPIAFAFLTGSGILTEKGMTDRAGTVPCRLARATGAEEHQIVGGRIDLSRFVAADSLSLYFQTVIQTLTLPQARFTIQVSPPAICLRAREINQERRLAQPIIEPMLKRRLLDEGFQYTDDSASADYCISVFARTRNGSKMRSLHACRVNVTVTMVDPASGNQVYKNSVLNVKGIKLDYENAGLAAMENAAKKVNAGIVPELLEAME